MFILLHRIKLGFRFCCLKFVEIYFQKFHNRIRWLVDERDTRSYRWRTNLSHTLLASLCIRFVAASIAARYDWNRYFAIDISLKEFERNSAVVVDRDFFFWLTAILLQNLFWFHRLLFSSPNVAWLRHVYDLVVRNREQFFHINRNCYAINEEQPKQEQETKDEDMYNCVEIKVKRKKRNSNNNGNFWSFFSVIRNLLCNQSKIRFYHRRLQLYPRLLHRTRAKTLALTLLIDFIYRINSMFNYVMVIPFLLYYYRKILIPRYDLTLARLIMSDLICALVVVGSMLDKYIQALLSLMLLSYVHRAYLRTKVECKLRLIADGKVVRRKSRLLRMSFREHNRIITYVTQIDEKCSKALFATFVSTLLFNIYLISRLLGICYIDHTIKRRPLLPLQTSTARKVDRFAIMTLLEMQLIAMMLTATMMLRIIEAIHSVAKNCPRILQNGVANHHDRLMVSHFYETIHDGHRSMQRRNGRGRPLAAFTVGPLGRVTRLTITHFTFAYCGYLLLIAKLVRKCYR